jgi:Tol biopolymer transport system component
LVRRDLTFGVVAVALVVLYSWAASLLAPAVAPVAAVPTPTPTPLPERTGAPRVPGAIAFVLRGDVYVLSDGRYAALTSEARNSQPSLSADGATLYFVRREEIDGKRVVEGALVNARLRFSSIVRKPAGGGSEEVVLGGLRQRSATGQHVVSWYLGPAISADGRRLAYLVDNGSGAADLALLTITTGSAAATGSPRVTPRPTGVPLSQGADLADASWSPDGRTIAVTTYTREVPGLLLWSVDRPGTAQRITGLPDGDAYQPSYSPDGRWLIYTLRRGHRNDVHAYEIATKRDVALTDDGRSWAGVMSPDGGWVAFLRERGGTIDLYAMELGDALSGGRPKEAIKLTRGEGIDGSSRPSWSR